MTPIAYRTGVVARPILHTPVIPLVAGAELLVHLVVPGDPVPKARPRVTRTHAYTPRRTLDAEARLVGYLKAKYPRLRPAAGSLSVSVECHFRGQPRVDVDNLLKLVLDACNRVVWADDSQIVEAHVRKHLKSPLPRTDIHVWLLND